jgi:phytoene synthase
LKETAAKTPMGPFRSPSDDSVGVQSAPASSVAPADWSAGHHEGLAASQAWCLSCTRSSASSFYYSFWTLPRPVYRDMCVLYAFMRVSDDLGDDESIPQVQRTARLDRWRLDVAAALETGRCGHPLLPALADLVARHELPVEHLLAVIEGVRRDLDFQGFETFDELSDYCYHVAGTVGLCCIHIWGYTDARATPLAIDCGRAFQVTNILRDLAEDAKRGRCYVPREDLRRFGLTPNDLRQAAPDARFSALMRYQVSRARDDFRRAAALPAYCRPVGRPILAAMLGTYGSLLDRIEAAGYEVRDRRIRLSRWELIRIAASAHLRHRWLAPR